MTEQDLGPRPQFTVRGRDGIQTFLVPRGDQPLEENPLFPPQSGAYQYEYSADGRLLAFVYSEEIVVYDAYSGETRYRIELCERERQRITAIAFSPRGNFLVTWEKPPGTKAEDLNKDLDIPPNLAIYRLSDDATVSEVSRFVFKKFVREYWPPTIWSEDEAICARMVNNEVHFYDGANVSPQEIRHKLHLKNIERISVAPGPPPHHIATFVPEKKGAPGRASLYAFPNLGEGQAIASKSFYKADKVDFHWNKTGSAILIFVQSEVDKTGKSYYGEMNLYLFHTDGKVEERVALDKEGPIHDISWMPNGKEFIVIYGFMPATATLYDAKAKPLFAFGAAHRNTIKPSPHGRFICLGGFGNLQGDMDFWDRNKKKRMATSKAECAVEHIWSPDSRNFLTAITFPRMRVDNSFTLYNYAGDFVQKMLIPEVMEVKWRPAPEGMYADRPASPGRAKASDAAAAAADAPPKPVGAYRPPGARGGASFKLHDDVEVQPQTTLTNLAQAQKSTPFVPIGGEPEKLSKSAIKNLKKKEKKKQEAANASGNQEVVEQQVAAVAIAEPPSAVEVEKKIRAVKKKIRQIEELKERQAGGETLEKTQIQKIESLPTLEAELAGLEGQN
jgi:translation initiation factor 2A